MEIKRLLAAFFVLYDARLAFFRQVPRTYGKEWVDYKCAISLLEELFSEMKCETVKWS